MIIGLDFDNTIVCYDAAFHGAGLARGLIAADIAPTKGAVRDYLRATGREDDWTELQGYVYGPGMELAAAYPGVLDFIADATSMGNEVVIISHKTRHPYRGPAHDLHAACRKFLDRAGLSEHPVYLEETKEAKLKRIGQQECDLFIDDLPEFLAEADFPHGVERILFDPHGAHDGETRFSRASSWSELRSSLLC